MSLSAIIAALPTLNRPELETLDARVHELLTRANQPASRHWNEALTEWAGSVKEGLPEDYALNHDHYLHGAPKR